MTDTSVPADDLSDETVTEVVSKIKDADTQDSVRKLLARMKAKYDATAELAKAADKVSELWNGTAARHDSVGRVIDYLQTPPFYVVLGLALIAISYLGTTTSLNSSLNFIVVILGIAILLYGTGSQAAATLGVDAKQASALLQAYMASSPGKRTDRLLGQVQEALDKPTANGGVNIAIAGGAAVLAAFFGYGIITYREGILQTLREWDRYSVVTVDLCYQDPASATCLDLDHASQATPVVDEAIRQTLALRSGNGAPVYRRVSDGSLQFVVFEGDLGKDRDVTFVPHTEVDKLGRSDTKFVLGKSYIFSLPTDIKQHVDGSCIVYVDGDKQDCALTYEGDEKNERGGVAYYHIMAHIYSQTSRVPVVVSD